MTKEQYEAFAKELVAGKAGDIKYISCEPSYAGDIPQRQDLSIEKNGGLFCPDCDGRGYIIVDCSNENEIVQDTRKCDFCDGTGRVLDGIRLYGKETG